MNDGFEWLKINALRAGAVTEVSNFLTSLDSAYRALWSLEYPVRGLNPRFSVEEVLGLEMGSSLPSGRLNRRRLEIPPRFELRIARVSIESPGFWEFVGSLNPLRHIRLYLSERHERRKDVSYKEGAERERLDLENDLLRMQVLEAETSVAAGRIKLLRDLGWSEERIEQALWNGVGIPLSRIGRHQDSGMISAPRPSNA